jgi:hypothetical protein
MTMASRHHEAYKRKEQAFILRLASDACLEGSGELDKVERTNRIRVFAMEDALRKRLRSLAGQPVNRIERAAGDRSPQNPDFTTAIAN